MRYIIECLFKNAYILFCLGDFLDIRDAIILLKIDLSLRVVIVEQSRCAIVHKYKTISNTPIRSRINPLFFSLFCLRIRYRKHLPKVFLIIIN